LSAVRAALLSIGSCCPPPPQPAGAQVKVKTRGR
jgi:hypothetical protein